ncbi:hypothetical protein CARUB_v10012338mg [Capsella rubella]|uniref:Uncharacterized protein n=1 Tax=Capsella rubella TaxID=81985 RepID=R0GP15_9BRAS|nr:hypothetical protein CARUB_v10012338mg [Capsella rubella]
MKYSTLFMVSCLVMVFVTNNIKEVKSVCVEQAGGVCEYTGEYPGKCGNDGKKTCIESISKKGSPGEGKKNLRCECFDNPVVILGRPKRICRCRNNC